MKQIKDSRSKEPTILKIGRILKNSPFLYQFSKRIYDVYYSNLRFGHIKEIAFGTKAVEKDWAMRKLQSAENYWDNRNNSAKKFFVNNVCNFNFSPKSIFEIGCNSGANLYQLAKKFPNAEITGIDINEIAIKKGNEWLKQEDILNVNLLVGKADELKRFPDKSFDVVFTWAVLIYVGSDKIKTVMKEMVRITRKRLILLEYSDKDINKDLQGKGVYCNGYWKRNYVGLLKQFIPNFLEDNIHISKFPKNLWSPAKGGGMLFEFNLTQGKD